MNILVLGVFGVSLILRWQGRGFALILVLSDRLQLDRQFFGSPESSEGFISIFFYFARSWGFGLVWVARIWAFGLVFESEMLALLVSFPFLVGLDCSRWLADVLLAFLCFPGLVTPSRTSCRGEEVLIGWDEQRILGAAWWRSWVHWGELIERCLGVGRVVGVLVQVFWGLVVFLEGVWLEVAVLVMWFDGVFGVDSSSKSFVWSYCHPAGCWWQAGCFLKPRGSWIVRRYTSLEVFVYYLGIPFISLSPSISCILTRYLWVLFLRRKRTAPQAMAVVTTKQKLDRLRSVERKDGFGFGRSSAGVFFLFLGGEQ